MYYNRARLDSIELLPFREVIRAGLGGIMVGHLRVPELEPDRLTAASLVTKCRDRCFKKRVRLSRIGVY